MTTEQIQQPEYEKPISHILYCWTKIFAAMRFKKKTGIIRLTPEVQATLLSDLEKCLPLEKENQELKKWMKESIQARVDETASLREQLDQLKKVLTELVALKDIKEKYDEPCNISLRDSDLISDYLKRKPLAWEAARKLVAQPPNQPELPASEQ